MTLPIQFGDEFGPISNRMCMKCGHFVYENAAMHYGNKHDVWFFLCRHCDERLMAIFTHTQAQIEARVKFNAELEANRFKLAQEKAIRRKHEVEQLNLWGNENQ